MAQSVQGPFKGWAVRESNPGGGEFFCTRSDLPGAHPASYIMGTGSFKRVKRPGRGVNHPTPSSVQVTDRVELHLYSTSGHVILYSRLIHCMCANALRIHTGAGRQDELCSKQLLKDELQRNWHYGVKWKKSDQIKNYANGAGARSDQVIVALTRTKVSETRAQTHLKRKWNTRFLQLINSTYVLSVPSFSCSYVEFFFLIWHKNTAIAEERSVTTRGVHVLRSPNLLFI